MGKESIITLIYIYNCGALSCHNFTGTGKQCSPPRNTVIQQSASAKTLRAKPINTCGLNYSLDVIQLFANIYTNNIGLALHSRLVYSIIQEIYN